MKHAALDLQEAITTALKGDAPLVAAVTGIFDAPPQHQPMPYVELGDLVANDGDTKSTIGLEHQIEFYIWSEYQGKKEALEIMGLIDGILHNASLTLTDHILVNLRREFETTRVDADDKTTEGILRYRAYTQEI